MTGEVAKIQQLEAGETEDAAIETGVDESSPTRLSARGVGPLGSIWRNRVAARRRTKR